MQSRCWCSSAYKYGMQIGLDIVSGRALIPNPFCRGVAAADGADPIGSEGVAGPTRSAAISATVRTARLRTMTSVYDREGRDDTWWGCGLHRGGGHRSRCWREIRAASQPPAIRPTARQQHLACERVQKLDDGHQTMTD